MPLKLIFQKYVILKIKLQGYFCVKTLNAVCFKIADSTVCLCTSKINKNLKNQVKYCQIFSDLVII